MIHKIQKGILCIALLSTHFLISAQTVGNVAQYPLMIPYRVGNQWGFADTLGKVLVEPRFDSVGLFRFNHDMKIALACFREKGKMGAINPQMEVVIPAKFTKIYVDDRAEWYLRYSTFAVQDGKRYGAYNAFGKEIIPVNFDDVKCNYLQKRALVKKDGKYGLFNSDGKQIAETIYDTIVAVSLQPNVKGFIAQIKEERFYLDLDGNVSKEIPELSVRPASVAAYTERDNGTKPEVLQEMAQKHGYEAVESIPGNAAYFRTRKGKQYGVIWYDGKVILPPTYDQVLAVASSPALVKFKLMCFVRKGQYVGAVDQNNKVLWPFEYDSVEPVVGTEDFLTKKGDKKGCFMQTSLYPPVRAEYQEIGSFAGLPTKRGYAFGLLRAKKDGQWGFIGENGVEYFQK